MAKKVKKSKKEKESKKKSAIGGRPSHNSLSICANCDLTWEDFQLAEITHGIWERVSPGEIMPSGECPECGALCHPIREDSHKKLFDAVETVLARVDHTNINTTIGEMTDTWDLLRKAIAEETV